MYAEPAVYGVPPDGLTTVAVPSINPLHVISVLVVGSAANGGGSEKLIGPISAKMPAAELAA